jgi:hypothetical protein
MQGSPTFASAYVIFSEGSPTSLEIFKCNQSRSCSRQRAAMML